MATLLSSQGRPLDTTPGDLLNGNTRWVAENSPSPGILPGNADYDQLDCKILWIGCADSRVPESVITKQSPGQIFVHRNIANQFPEGDLNALAVLGHAVRTLKVNHIIVAGHTYCGGARASYDRAHPDYTQSIQTPFTFCHSEPDDPVIKWLAPLIKLAESLPSETDPVKRDKVVRDLTIKNVEEQVKNVVRVDVGNVDGVVQVHGWLHDVVSGRLEDLNVTLSMGNATKY